MSLTAPALLDYRSPVVDTKTTGICSPDGAAISRGQYATRLFCRLGVSSNGRPGGRSRKARRCSTGLQTSVSVAHPFCSGSAVTNRNWSTAMTPTALTFKNTTLSIVDRNGQPWLTAVDIAKALGYANDDAAGKLYNRNKAEFTEEMTATVKLTVAGMPYEQRIFSPRGAHLLAMFARTPVAREFRQWVLDVLEGKAAVSQPSISEAFGLRRWLVHVDAQSNLVWNEIPRDAVIVPRQELVDIIGKAWWGCVDAIGELEKYRSHHELPVPGKLK